MEDGEENNGKSGGLKIEAEIRNKLK